MEAKEMGNDIPLYRNGHQRAIEHNGYVYVAINNSAETDVIEDGGDWLFSVPLGMQDHMIQAALDIYDIAYQRGRTVGRTELQSELRRLLG
jgi:hypothetical protein